MTTIPDAIKATLDAQWTGAGGTEPTYYVGEDYTYSSPPPAGKDYIWIISKDLDTQIRPVNDIYSTETHTIPIIVNTLTSGDRLKEIADEVQRILGTVAITGANFQRLSRRSLNPPEKLRSHREEMILTIISFLVDSGTAYGAYTTTTFVTDVLTVNTSFTLGRTVTAILDEDNMASDSDASLATQQSIKAYADAIGTAAAADVDADIVTHAAITDAHHTKYTDAEVEAIITAELVNGQSIDNAIDALIATHKAGASEHHAKYTDAEVEAIITAELVNGQSIDNAIDALITTHAGVAAAHHAKYTDAEVEAIITAEIVDGQSIDNAIDALITTHTAIATAHQDAPALIAAHAGDDDAHHAVVESHDDLDDTTLTGAYLEDLLMFGSGNSAWVPVSFLANYGHDVYVTDNDMTTGYITVSSASGCYLLFVLNMPTNKGGLSLHISASGVRFYSHDADVNNYITNVALIGIQADGTQTVIDTTDTTNYTSTGLKTCSVPDAETDCTSYNAMYVKIQCTTDTAFALDFSQLAVNCFYDT